MRSNDVAVIRSSGFSLTGILYEIKRGFMENLRQVLGEPEASLAGGLVVGEKDSLGKELLDDFRKVGLIHIVVLSGYNITIIATTIQRICHSYRKPSAMSSADSASYCSACWSAEEPPSFARALWR